MFSTLRSYLPTKSLTFSTQYLRCFYSKHPQHSCCHTSHNQTQPGKYVYIPQFQQNKLLSQEQLQREAKNIYQWAKQNKVQRYSFLAYPHTSSISQKQESFLNILKFFNRRSFKDSINYQFKGSTLTKAEGDGSSFPSGGLRETHTARGHMLWDHRSHLYIRQKNKLLYIPSLLITHQGYAQDDKTLYRQSEKILQQYVLHLLKFLGIQSSKTKIMVGFQQQFFVIPKESFEKRQDLKWLGRCLVGSPPIRNQQLGEHYYSKMPEVIEKVLEQVQAQLIGMGIPFKTRHNEVAVNQFQIACIFDETGVAIDHNMIIMEVLKQTFDRHSLKVLLHQKPFKGINGSGKHANWSLFYQKKNGQYKNIFKISEKDTQEDLMASKIAMILQLSTLHKHHRLYLSSIATPGNQVRLGGHQAPPRIFSAYLGTSLTHFLYDSKPQKSKNLRDIVTSLSFDTFQDSNDRNRTSPYAFTGNRWQFRAVGSSQNPSYCMAVITSTFASEIKNLLASLDKGVPLEQWMTKTLKESQVIVFEGNGYTSEWRQEARRRGLYVNEQFAQLYEFLDTEQKVFSDLGVCSQIQNKARSQVAKNIYKQTVQIQCETLLNIINRHIIPEGCTYLKLLKPQFDSTILNSHYEDIKRKFVQVVENAKKLKQLQQKASSGIKEHQILRSKVQEVSGVITNFMSILPKSKDFPNQMDFLNL